MHQTITSTAFQARNDSKTDDSFVQIQDRFFGQVLEILWLPEYKAAFLLLQLFEKVAVKDRDNEDIKFPLNQFPVHRTSETKVFHVTRKLFVQKIQQGELIFREMTWQSDVMMFSVRPNEWFRF